MERDSSIGRNMERKLQLYIYGKHKISACHREIEVFCHHVAAIERAIGITVGFVSPVEDIV
jgi:hypothetical protein